MEKITLIIFSCLSCYIIVSILFQFMDERYIKVYKKKYIYFSIKIVVTLSIAIINVLNNPALNLITWIILIALCAFFLYYGEYDKPTKQVIECEVLLLCVGICEAFGVVLANWLLDIFQIQISKETIKSCIIVSFSKVIVIFIYYLAIVHLMKKKKVPYTKKQYGLNLFILIYSLINLLVIAREMATGQESYILYFIHKHGIYYISRTLFTEFFKSFRGKKLFGIRSKSIRETSTNPIRILCESGAKI